MAKTIIRACDLCAKTDGIDGTTVRNTTIVGPPRKDLCDDCRAAILEVAGYTPEESAKIIAAHDAEKVRKPKPGTAPAEPETAPGDESALPADDAPTEPETAPESAPEPAAKNGRAKAPANA